MPYGDFSIEEVKARYRLRIAETEEYFAKIPPVTVSDFLIQMMAENIPLAVAICTEKARSELIIAPVLLEARRQVQRRVSLFSGGEFTLDPSQGFKGGCDFLLSLSPEQLTIEVPVVLVVEAKNDSLKVSLDLREYPISELGRVVVFLVSMVRPENMDTRFKHLPGGSVPAPDQASLLPNPSVLLVLHGDAGNYGLIVGGEQEHMAERTPIVNLVRNMFFSSSFA